MAHYEERLEHDLTEISERSSALIAHVEEAIQNSVRAVLTGNEKLAYLTILGDARINRLVHELDKRCHAFNAVHLPSAGHLRHISSIIRTNLQLERIGDYAVTISREATQLRNPPAGELASSLETFSQDALRMLDLALKAYKTSDGNLARSTMDVGAAVETSLDDVYQHLMQNESGLEIRERVALFVVFNMLKRVFDQAKNVCEETVFAVFGESKAEAVHGILFIDEDNSSLSQIAEAFARKQYPESGHYASAGRRAAEQLDPCTVTFLQNHGLIAAGAKPKVLDTSHDAVAPYRVVVSLEGPPKSYITSPPFHTSLLDWDIGSIPGDLDEAQRMSRLEEAYRDIALHVRDLMEMLRGEGAR